MRLAELFTTVAIWLEWQRWLWVLAFRQQPMRILNMGDVPERVLLRLRDYGSSDPDMAELQFHAKVELLLRAHRAKRDHDSEQRCAA